MKQGINTNSYLIEKKERVETLFGGGRKCSGKSPTFTVPNMLYVVLIEFTVYISFSFTTKDCYNRAKYRKTME